MKNFWKVLGITALAVAVPVSIKKNETTGKKKYQSLLISVDVGPGKNDDGTEIGINIGDGVLSSAIMNILSAKKENVHFADDEPEAAVVEPITVEETGEPADEETPASEPHSGTVEATEEDFDPEL